MDQNYGKISPEDELGEDADNPKALAQLGDRYFEGGRYVEAVDIYNKVLSLDPNDVDTYNDLGLAYQYLKQPDKAIETLRKGSEIMPSYQRIWISLGFVLSSAGNNTEAKTALSKAVELGPDTPVGIEAKRMLGQIN
jgi:tetratricopeptide (TPR) repeat protein